MDGHRVTFDKRDKKYWESWLPAKFAKRIARIREHVQELWTNTSSNTPQTQWYTPHGPSHFKAVENLIHRLIPFKRHKLLSEYEKFLLLASAWIHDIGMLRGILPGDESVTDDTLREEHHLRTGIYLAEKYAFITVEENEVLAFSLLAKFHRRRTKLADCPEILNVAGRNVRLRLLAAYLRLADALHIDITRAPGNEYAIMLTYDIPSASKLHWLRSKFVSGLDVDYKQKEIEIQFQRFVHGTTSSILAMKMLEGIYEQVVSDLEEELNSVKDVLFDADISYFLRIKKRIIDVEVDATHFSDAGTIFNYYYLLDNPSSSSLLELLLEAVRGIIETHSGEERELPKGNREKKALDAIHKVLKDVQERVLKSRRCHFGLSSLVDALHTTLADGDIEKVHDLVKGQLSLLDATRQDLQSNARACYKSFLASYLTPGNKRLVPGNTPKDETTGEAIRDGDPTQRLTILMYGYSELVIRSLLGFREAVLEDMISKDLQSARSRLDLDSTRSAVNDMFNIFICEGQPKNSTGWGGRLVFHDGIRFSQTIARHGFSNIFVIPDAIAASLLTSSNGDDGPPSIDLVMVGTNGFDENAFRHSAGHAMIASMVRFARMQTPGGGKRVPTLLLALSSGKFRSRSVAAATSHPSGKPVIVRDGWRFRNSFGSEPVRSQPFVSQDPRILEMLSKEGKNILFYNPREDSISIDLVDLVITEKAWLFREWETKWDGQIIANRQANSSRPRASKAEAEPRKSAPDGGEPG